MSKAVSSSSLVVSILSFKMTYNGLVFGNESFTGNTQSELFNSSLSLRRKQDSLNCSLISDQSFQILSIRSSGTYFT